MSKIPTYPLNYKMRARTHTHTHTHTHTSVDSPQNIGHLCVNIFSPHTCVHMNECVCVCVFVCVLLYGQLARASRQLDTHVIPLHPMIGISHRYTLAPTHTQTQSSHTHACANTHTHTNNSWKHRETHKLTHKQKTS